MSFTSWLQNLRSALAPGRGQRHHRRRGSLRAATHRPNLEVLEDRCLLSFSPVASFPAGISPQAVVTADFNGDGRLDLATANYGDNTVSVLLGNANGTFQPAQNSPTGTTPLSVAVGDFNGDGKLDLATANAGDVSVLPGNGDGTFQAPSSTGVAGNPASVAVGDFNGDGKLDLGVTSNVYHPATPGYYDGWGGYHYGADAYTDGQVNVLLGTGTGSFAAPIASYLGYGWDYTSAAVADFNGDLNLDFAATSSYENGTVDVVLGSGTGAFGSPVAFSNGYGPWSVAAGDVNADGKPDLVTANFFGDVSVWLGTGTGATWSFGAFTNYAAGSPPGSVAMADFNGDGKIDLVTANQDAGSVSVLLGTGTGSFKPPVNAAVAPYPLGMAVGDFNGDGRPDAASASSNSNNVSVLLNDGIWPALDAPSISINDVTVTEGNIGTTAATFTVSLSATYVQTVSIHYATADGDNTVAGSDYQAASGTLTFNPGGPLTQTITVQVIGDRLPEGNQSFSVRLTDPTNAFVVDVTGVGTILDDEPYVSIVDYVSGLEGNTGTTPFTFTVTLSAAYDAPVTLDYATADFTPDGEYWLGPGATAGVDYTATSGTVTFAAGETSKTITVLVNGDRLDEPDESFFVNLSNPTGAGTHSVQAWATIMDDDHISFLVSGFPSPATAGEAHTITVTALDYFGNAVTDYTGTVTFTSSDPRAVLPGPYTFTTGVGGDDDNGTHSFTTVTLKTAGTQSLTVTDTTTPDFNGTQTGIVVNPAAASTFVVTGFPSTITSGVAGAFTVTAFDAYGNTATNYTGTVHFTSSDGSATLPGNYTFAAAENGTHTTFTATLRTAGTQSLTATDTVSPSITGSQAGIRVIPLATIAGPSAGLPNQTLTFTLGANSGLPAGTVFTYTIDWNGDGSVDLTVSGPSGATANHTYAAGGTYSIGVTATVHIGTQDYTSVFAHKYVTVIAVSVTIQTDPGDATLKALVVEGTANAETLVLSPGTGNSVALSVNGTAVGTIAVPGGVAFGHLLVYGYGGNDTLRLTGGLTVPAFLFGGDGNDILDAGGSTANNVLVGGAGADALTGGSGRDLLIGGVGGDTLRGGGGDDILIGGYTVYDADLTALCAIMKEWGRTTGIGADYNTRVKNLTDGTGSTNRVNGSYFLTARTVKTVSDDATIDSLYGEAGLDWFFARKTGNKKDKVNDLSTGEVFTAIS